MIRFEHVSKRFGRHRAVDDFSLHAGAGQVVALLGPNGSGKTTALKIAAGLLRPTAGVVTLGDPPIPASEPRARIVLSFLPQKVAFPEALSGSEVVEFYRRLRSLPGRRSAEVLAFASLNGAGGRAVGTYSGGMLQRLGLAVALLPGAPVFLLDEPTAALDPEGLCAFYGAVQRARAEGRTVLFSSHQLGDVERLADRVAVIVEGRLVASFTARELQDRLADRGVMRVRLARRIPGLQEALERHSPQAHWQGGDLVVPGAAASRPAVLETIRQAGGEIASLTTEEGRLDGLYRELVGGAS